MTAAPEAPARKWTARDMESAMFGHFTQQGYAVIGEITAGATPETPFAPGRRIDVLCLRKARRMGIGHLERLAIEIKVSRSDFLADVRNPEKQAPWREFAHRHAYAVPEGLVAPEEVPGGSGLLVVSTRASWGGQREAAVTKWALRAPFTDTNPAIPSWLTASLAHRLSWSEARVKGWTGLLDQEEASPEVLRAEVQRLKASLDRESNRADRERDAHLSWKAAFAATGGLPCEECGQLVRPSRLGRGGAYLAWRHTDRAHEEPCKVARAARVEAEAKARWEGLPEDDKAHRLKDAWIDKTEPWRSWLYVPEVAPREDA